MINTPLSQAKTFLKQQKHEEKGLPSTNDEYHRLDEVSFPKSTEVHKHDRKITFAGELKGLRHMFDSWVSYLLVFVPIGFLSEHYGMSAGWRFFLNFVALIPLANALGNATEELALHTGETIGGLLNATFGNAVEMIITIQALRAGMIDLVKGTLLGSVLSNLLLVLGMSFFFAGIKFPESKFNAQGAGANVSLLLLSTLGITLPSLFRYQPGATFEDVLHVSRVSSLLIGGVYILFLVFQLITHSALFADQADEDDEEEEIAVISAPTAMGMLAFITLLTSFTSDVLVDSVQEFTVDFNVSQLFIGIILLPLAGNAVEHWTAVSVAMKDKLDLSLGVAAGSSTQIALLVIPFAVVTGWICGVDMALDFSLVEVSVLFISVLIVMAIVQDGKSNWLEGVMLCVAYMIIAVLFWYSPDPNGAKAPSHLPSV
eukprot:GDKJ01026145.1.p1 GENE.GDKJ01026145.1~~GDKJ01026145.1.p1  ORF type:complete len:430 (+),score=127.07 GDKJ01026145.1:41-1330(+)